MSTEAFDMLTDWIGIPLVIAVVALAVFLDWSSIDRRRLGRRPLMLGVVLTAVVLVIGVARFAFLA